MKLTTSAIPACAAVLALTLQGCANDVQVARVQSAVPDSPVGIWLTEAQVGEEAEIRQLMVIEALGSGDYRIHECALTANASEALSRTHFHGGRLRSGWAITDENFVQPYSESELITLVVDGHSLAGEYHQYDRNLDGSYVAHQVVGITGTRISTAQSLDTLSALEIQSMLGTGAAWTADTGHLGQTCAAVSTETDVASQLVAELFEEGGTPTVLAGGR
ncbi:hypothetical protein [uncultured Thalassolituus sp.]|uniref:hypothetical protein n=1 Tax=Thalassolituus sp. TaxID=2030822 RepID=UPI002613C73F|nr:hypothetical protein [uncultured Thalassolituus sp.]